MDINITNALYEYLQERGKVTLPGIGSFTLSNEKRDYVVSGNSIRPPSEKIEFSEDVLDDESFVKFYASKSEKKNAKAEKQVANYGQDILNGLLNHGAVHIPRIGKLVKKSENAIGFISAEDAFSRNHYLLPKIRLQPLDEGVSRSMADGIIVKDVPKPIVVSEVISTPKSEVKPTSIAYTPIVPPVEESKTESDKDGFPWLWPLLGILALALLSIFLFKQCNKSVTTKSQITENSQEAVVDSSNNSEVVAMPKFDNPNLEKYSAFLTEDIVNTGCIIIVGSFKKATNAVRMRDKIVRAGLQPYSEISGDFTRVGIIFECGENDLVEYIGQIRNTFDKYAWYLSPEMEVPR